MVDQPSKAIEQMAKVRPMVGASQKIVAMGLFIPMDFLSSSIWVRDHLKPPIQEADRTSIIPQKSNLVSEETIRTTPEVIKRIIPVSL